MKIYTRSGDEGSTGLFGGARVAKDDLRIEAYGTVDELNALLGLVRAAGPPEAAAAVVERIQHELFHLGAQLAALDPSRLKVSLIGAKQIETAERDIDRFERQLPTLTAFILPGGSAAAATLHVARTVCRRAERRLVTLRAADPDGVPDVLLRYLNRLGDLLFVLARVANQATSTEEPVWKPQP
jgi:cob(I)alamin adenosyltransferase